MKTRTHNEYFRPVKDKKCQCGTKASDHPDGVWSWGEYVGGKWRNVMRVCFRCWYFRALPTLVNHKADCGCAFNLVGYRTKLPFWISIPEVTVCEKEPS